MKSASTSRSNCSVSACFNNEGIARTQTYELGYFSVFINLNAEEEEFNYIPYEYSLEPAYPNPFNPLTSIQFDIPLESDVNLSVYDIEGRLIKNLISKSYEAGEHTVEWNAEGFSSGMYLIKMETPRYHKMMKVVLLK